MNWINILWVDDEIDLLKPHILFLKERGYQTTPCSNGRDALELLSNNDFDIVLLDENMPGLNGLETLGELKNIRPNLAVIMITKNEEEQLMNEAIGAKISDYLIKPVNPNQILHSLKKILNHKDLIAEKTTQNYQKEFREISLSLAGLHSYQDWVAYFKKLIYWELELETLDDKSLLEAFEIQLKEANHQFAKFIAENYSDWLQNSEGPVLSHKAFEKLVLPELKTKQPTLLLMIDNLRYDQWKILAPQLNEYFSLVSEKAYFSILPTTTQYARNAFFAGETPQKISEKFPHWWKNDNDEGGKNLHEYDLLQVQLKRLGITRKSSFHKITQLQQCHQLIKNLANHTHEGITTVVYNFVDMISHAKTEMEVIKELASDSKSYRSLTATWFKNSPLKELLKKASELGYQILLTTDHGTVNVAAPSQVIGDKETGINLRYKSGKSLTFEAKDVLCCENPSAFELPSFYGINSRYIFARGDAYFVYKNNLNYYAKLFKDTFQHGGISLEEMIIPFVVLKGR